jgi:hypothetical protein
VEIFRVSKDAYGQETLIGVSWDLLWWFIVAALLFIVAHIIYKFLFAPKADGAAISGEDGEAVSKT